MIPTQVATVLLVQDLKVLMAQRRSDKLYGLSWEFPGGKVEPGETTTEAVIRETYEEIRVQLLNESEYFRDTMTYSNGVTYDVTFFICHEFEGIPENTEFNALGWFSSNELMDIQHLSGNKNIIAKLISEGIPASL